MATQQLQELIDEASASPAKRPRFALIGVVARTIRIGCCVYPVVLVLMGLATSSAAVGLGNRLYGEWGWAFKLAGLGFAAAAIFVQRTRARRSGVADRSTLPRAVLWVGITGTASYAALYALTTLLGRLA